MTWKKIVTKRVYQNPYFAVDEDDVIRPDGSEGVYYVFRPKGGVAVIAFDGEKLLMVNQYRYPLQRRIWSFVAGSAEDGLDDLALAQKELQEEAGYAAERWTLLGGFPNSPSLSGQGSQVFLAEGLTEGQHRREPGEMDMEHKFFTFAEVEALIGTGELSAFDIADFYLFKQHVAKRI